MHTGLRLPPQRQANLQPCSIAGHPCDDSQSSMAVSRTAAAQGPDAIGLSGAAFIQGSTSRRSIGSTGQLNRSISKQ